MISAIHQGARAEIPAPGRRDGEIEVRGAVSGSFAIFRGDGRGLGEPGCSLFSLVHPPSRRIIDTLHLRRKSCNAQPAELAMLRVNWRERRPGEGLGRRSRPGEGTQSLLRLLEKLNRPLQIRGGGPLWGPSPSSWLLAQLTTLCAIKF